MALSMEEQRILAQIEQELSRAEPKLAVRLSTFADPVPVAVLRSARVRVMASLAALLMLAVTSVVVYTFFMLRGAPQRGEFARPTAAPARSVRSGPSTQASQISPVMSSSAVAHNTPAVIMRGEP
jgi:Protein of unknown function (DUF3040)